MTAGRVVILMCFAEALSMTTFATYPALIPVILPAWGLTNSEAGLISGMFFGGYMAAVPVLTSLTDRIDARRVYAFSCALGAAGSLGFALFANGVVSAVICHTLIGAGLAGTYMPGLKLLSDVLEDAPKRSRYVAFYTSTFGMGLTVSLLLVGLVEPNFGWRVAFAAAGLGPLAAGALVWLTLPPSKIVAHPQPRGHLLDFRPVFRNRAATGYVLGYAAHCYELFGMRSWLVAFLAFSAALQPADQPLPWGPAWIAAAVTPLGILSSILGNEIAARLRRRNVILAAMVMSAASAAIVGFLAPLPWYVVVVAITIYIVFIMGDSAALTNGVIVEASPHLRGATMAIHSFLGFGAGMIAPLVFGAILDLAGGNTNVLAWGLAFASLGVGCAIATITVALGNYRNT
ncbi:MAG TPA: MFS transporter [Burkholderiales bacterium]|nr:MFS transporter [Burkholderiales bacterium]